MLQGLPNTLQIQPQHHKRKSLGDLGLRLPILDSWESEGQDSSRHSGYRQVALLLLQTLLWAQKGSICSMFNTKWQQLLCSHNKISHRVSREMYTGREDWS